MALFNHAKREINAKIVYFGCEGAGKRGSLQYIFDRIKPALRGELKTPASSGDPLFFFDFSPFEKPVFGNYSIRFHVYTLPGKVANPAAWKMTLKGADGVVIVADATPELLPAARQSISDLRGFLSAYGVGLQDIPGVLQLTMTGSTRHRAAADLAAELDLPHLEARFSDAVSGEGVLEIFSLLSRQIMTRVGQDDALRVAQSNTVPVHDEGSDDGEVSAALAVLDRETVRPVYEVSADDATASELPVAASGEYGNLRIEITAEGASCREGVVRVPLEMTLAGSTRRLVLSIAIDQE
jgi:hypothetical protein